MLPEVSFPTTAEALRAMLARLKVMCAVVRRRDGRPYLERYYLVPAKDGGPGVFIHHMITSDPDPELHDHPWLESVSVVLAGSYTELRRDGRVRLLRQGDSNVIRGDDFHRVLIEDDCWTLFMHGPRVKSWGFLDERTGAYRVVDKRTGDEAE